jgi:hypothetical protein
MKKNLQKSPFILPETHPISNGFIGYGVPSISYYKIEPSNMFPLFTGELSFNDGRPTSMQIIDRHIEQYNAVWQALS